MPPRSSRKSMSRARRERLMKRKPEDRFTFVLETMFTKDAVAERKRRKAEIAERRAARLAGAK